MKETVGEDFNPLKGRLLWYRFSSSPTVFAETVTKVTGCYCGNTVNKSIFIIIIIIIIIITSARRLCNHLDLYVCMCVCMCMCMCVCVFVCEHDNSRNTKHIHTKFLECISHRLRKSWLIFGWIWVKIEREMNKILSCFSWSTKKTYWLRN
jgi:hypothetical protein